MALTKVTYSMIEGISLNVNDYGADPTGVTDSTTAIQSAIDAALANGQKVVAIGTYKISSKVVIKGDTDFSQAIFNVVSAPPIAVEISSGNAPDPTTIIENCVIWLPKEINNTTKPATGWAGQGYGVRVVNAYSCQIFVGYIGGFSRGLFITSKNTNGTVYTNFYLGHLDTNAINLMLSPLDATSWTNENNFFGGRFGFNSAEGTDVANTSQIFIDQSTTVSNNNIFYKPSLEGDVPQYHFICYGSYNTIIQGRWEAATPKVLYASTNSNEGSKNAIIDGYFVDNIVFVDDKHLYYQVKTDNDES
jgi:hypothetical protein